MTSTAAPATSLRAAARPAPRATGRPARQAPASRLRRTSEVVLVVGTVLAVGAAFGPGWLVRVGVGIAVTAAVLACVLAWRETFSDRRAHARELLATSHRHGQMVRAERSRHGEVVDTLSRRVTQAGVVIDGQQTVITTLRGEVSGLRLEISGLRLEASGLRGDRASLVGELAHRDTIITALRSTVRSREAELAELRSQGEREDGETARADLNRAETPVSHLPRRMLTEPERPGADVSRTDLPGADELWADGSQPAVLDLRMIDTAMVLPNYEVDRRVG